MDLYSVNQNSSLVHNVNYSSPSMYSSGGMSGFMPIGQSMNTPLAPAMNPMPNNMVYGPNRDQSCPSPIPVSMSANYNASLPPTSNSVLGPHSGSSNSNHGSPNADVNMNLNTNGWTSRDDSPIELQPVSNSMTQNLVSSMANSMGHPQHGNVGSSMSHLSQPLSNHLSQFPQPLSIPQRLSSFSHNGLHGYSTPKAYSAPSVCTLYSC